MKSDPASSVELLFGDGVTEQQEKDLVAAFEPWGFTTRVRRGLAHRGPEELEWLVLASLPLQAFLKGLGDAAVKDAYTGLKGLVGRLHKGENATLSAVTAPAPLVLSDIDSGLRIVFDADLPVEAYRQLRELDLSTFRIGPLHYDVARQRWRSELDEAASGRQI